VSLRADASARLDALPPAFALEKLVSVQLGILRHVIGGHGLPDHLVEAGADRLGAAALAEERGHEVPVLAVGLIQIGEQHRSRVSKDHSR